ncbi:carbohydrate kinase [Anopheles sinensis]|uniref:Carbohydrate kinase n=1 Tax=Anopheles sinensis TaxID=74873 RepID=A0A084W6P5_ANOSI|nr:carbohydrate kinase [Anopheles sinensis]
MWGWVRETQRFGGAFFGLGSCTQGEPNRSLRVHKVSSSNGCTLSQRKSGEEGFVASPGKEYHQWPMARMGVYLLEIGPAEGFIIGMSSDWF